jgi:hypothetical protein
MFCILILWLASPLRIPGKSRMRKRARTDLCGGRSAMVVPTATVTNAGSRDQPHDRATRSVRILTDEKSRLSEEKLRPGWDGGFLGQDFPDAANLGADAAQFLFDIFVAAVDVIDAVDNGFAIGN